MTGLWRPVKRAAHPPGAVRSVLFLPAVGAAELLRAKLGHHGRDVLLPASRPGLYDRAHGKSSGVVGIVRGGSIHPSDCALGIRVPFDEAERAVNGAARRR